MKPKDRYKILIYFFALTLFFSVSFYTYNNQSKLFPSITYDIRDCPLDRVTFASSSNISSFVVHSVATEYYYWCKDGSYPKEKTAGCFGPYGNLLLAGQYKDDQNDSPRDVVAILNWHKEASPCCGWVSFYQNKKKAAEKNQKAVWVKGRDVPLVRDLNIKILYHWDGYDKNFMNVFDEQMVPVKCN